MHPSCHPDPARDHRKGFLLVHKQHLKVGRQSDTLEKTAFICSVRIIRVPKILLIL